MILPSAQEPVPKPNRSPKAGRRPPASALKARRATGAGGPPKPVDLEPGPTHPGGSPAATEGLEAVSAAFDPGAVLGKLPLAEAVLALGSYVLGPAEMDRIFDAYRGRSFEKVLDFHTFVQLIADALLQHGGSGRQSFR